jgi:hypothetical protein
MNEPSSVSGRTYSKPGAPESKNKLR